MRIAIKTVQVITAIGLVSFLLVGCSARVEPAPSGLMEFTKFTGGLWDEPKRQGRWMDFKPAAFKPMGITGGELLPPKKQTFDQCVREGKQDGLSDRSILDWCIRTAQ